MLFYKSGHYYWYPYNITCMAIARQNTNVRKFVLWNCILLLSSQSHSKITRLAGQADPHVLLTAYTNFVTMPLPLNRMSGECCLQTLLPLNRMSGECCLHTLLPLNRMSGERCLHTPHPLTVCLANIVSIPHTPEPYVWRTLSSNPTPLNRMSGEHCLQTPNPFPYVGWNLTLLKWQVDVRAVPSVTMVLCFSWLRNTSCQTNCWMTAVGFLNLVLSVATG